MKVLERVPPRAIARRRGPLADRRRDGAYFDAVSSWWVNLFGHSDFGLISEAITDQLGKLAARDAGRLTHPPVVELSERLASLTGWATRFTPATGPAPPRSR
jgi:adenosylmethionine-8-amino-7-oxononanoate aminotransferase